MIEYANEFVIKLLKQYDMFSKSLRFITDLRQKKDICDQMTKIIQSVLEQTKAIYEEKFSRVAKRSVYLMDDEKNRLLELISLINERRVYINNQIVNNKELTGITIDSGVVLGEDKLDEYKSQVKIIDKYKNNVRMEGILKEELITIEGNIKKANNKIANNKNLNRQIEDKMIRIVDDALIKLSLYDLRDREKEIDLAYTELGYSLEKAKENAKVARRDYGEEIIVECDNMLAAVTLEYERYKEKKLILKLISLFRQPVENYDELLEKREKMNSILSSITGSELYSMIGSELNKEYATIKLEGQDIATLKSLIEERDNKQQILSEINIENNSEEFKKLLSNLLENERRHQEKLKEEKKKREQERLERQRQEERRKLEEIAKRQQALEEERKKEIERRTKQLLEEKQNPVLMPKVDKPKEEQQKRVVRQSQVELRRMPQVARENSASKPTSSTISAPRQETRSERNASGLDIFPRQAVRTTGQPNSKNDIFSRELKNNKIVDQGIPVIKNNKLESEVVAAETANANDKKVFPDIKLDKKINIFPNLPDTEETGTFFDESEFKDLSDYVENDKNGWF